jgi:titin
VSALPTSATAIQLEWASVDGAAGYDVERSTDSVAWSVVSEGTQQTRYTDLKLKSGTTYFYRVAAYVDGDDVVRSDVVSATTIGDTSTVPVLLSATGSATSVDLAWSDVDGELGYWIQRSPDGTNGWSTIGTQGIGVTSYTDTGLAIATTYFYRVIAMRPDGGSSDPSNALPATTGPAGPPTSEPNAAQPDASLGP